MGMNTPTSACATAPDGAGEIQEGAAGGICRHLCPVPIADALRPTPARLRANWSRRAAEQHHRTTGSHVPRRSPTRVAGAEQLRPLQAECAVPQSCPQGAPPGSPAALLHESVASVAGIRRAFTGVPPRRVPFAQRRRRSRPVPAALHRGRALTPAPNDETPRRARRHSNVIPAQAASVLWERTTGVSVGADRSSADCVRGRRPHSCSHDEH